ncbi:MAG TPA: thiolase family protein [Thermoanaerobaculia bacterium]|nr:thiolase family protein [Thermoanaerobaculia bacterium]
MTSSIVLAEGVRTAMADYNGLFSDTTATDLAVAASREALRRARFEPGEIGHVIFGNVLQTSPDAIYLARHVGLRSEVPKEVPALTVNRLCGSGFEAIVQAKQRILLGETDAVLAGGTENMSQAPFVVRGARTGLRLGQGKLEDSLMSSLFDTVPGLAMAQTSDNIARRHGISREEQDAFALESQQKAADARGKGRLAEEIVAVEAKKGRKTVTVSEDDHLTPDSTLEGLAKLAPAFGKDGMVTAGNASGIVDGAVAVVVTTEAKARAKGIVPLGRLVAEAVTGCDPAEMGLGPVSACRAALEKAGKSLGDMDLVEINEAFAGQILGVIKELAIDRAKLNVNGGAIALGHPLGASGARLTLTLLKELRRRGKRWGLASACIGGGQGIALVVEACV